MIHVSEMGRGYVGNPSEILAVGDEVQVRVLEVDPRRGRISLSMKDLPTENLDLDDEDVEELPTSMELALRNAMEEQGIELPPKRSTRRGKRGSKRRRDRVQDDIIARTLRAHQD
jgi:transcriptional accessory protein Tex/SPT6